MAEESAGVFEILTRLNMQGPYNWRCIGPCISVAALDQLVNSMNRRTQAMLERIHSGVILIEAKHKIREMIVGSGFGFGFLVGHCRALTAGHVVCEKNKIKFQLLFYIGHPGFTHCVKTGRFSLVRTVFEIDKLDVDAEDMFLDYFQAISDGNRRLFEVESAVASGSSRAAVVDEFGSVIGVVVIGTKNLVSDAGGDIGYVVPIEYCIELLKWTRGRKKTDSIFMYEDDEEN